MSGFGRNSWHGNHTELPAQFQCQICNSVVFGNEAFARHYDNHFLVNNIGGSFDRPRERIVPNVLPQNGGAAPPPPPLFNNNSLSFLGVPQPFSSEPMQMRPSQSAAATLPPQVPLIASAFTALHEQQRVQPPPTLPVEHQRMIFPANSSTSGAPGAIELAQSDGEEEDSMSEDSSEDDTDDTSSSSSNSNSSHG